MVNYNLKAIYLRYNREYNLKYCLGSTPKLRQTAKSCLGWTLFCWKCHRVQILISATDSCQYHQNCQRIPGRSVDLAILHRHIRQLKWATTATRSFPTLGCLWTLFLCVVNGWKYEQIKFPEINKTIKRRAIFHMGNIYFYLRRGTSTQVNGAETVVQRSWNSGFWGPEKLMA